MAAPTNEEQLMLELINRLRMDPDGEYARLTDAAVLAEIQGALNFFGVDLSSFQAAMLTYSAAAPLAWNENLAQAALTHNNLMITEDEQSHRLDGEAGLGDRITAAGYTGWSNLGENIYAYSDSVVYGHAGFVIDWGYDDEDFDSGGQRYSDWQTRGDGIQDPAGHLNSLMNQVFTEIGIAIATENDPNTGVGPYVITQDFGNRWSYSAQFVGVVIDDTDNDDFYDIGEGMGGVTVTLEGTGGEGTFSTTTWGSGGWQIDVPSGTYDISFTGGALVGEIEITATIGSANVKVDVEAADAVVSGNVQDGTSGIDILEGDGDDDVLNGLGDNDILRGFGGADILDGGAGDDDMFGGTGDDIYYFDSLADSATELTGEGTDRIITSVKINALLAGFDNIEAFELSGSANTLNGNDSAQELVANPNLTSKLFGYGGEDTLIGGIGNDKLYGGADDDILTGGEGRDRLDGGTGADDMTGGLGDDRYFVDDLGDTVTELSGEGIDLIKTTVDWTLGGNIENLRMGAGVVNGTGNALDNAIFAVSAGSVLRGMDGDDTLRGSNGDDTLYGDADNDELNGRSGNDDLYGGSGNDDIRGRSGEDTIRGASGNDTLNGGKDNDWISGGSDQDELKGEGGADVFHFADGDFAGLTDVTADRITDFSQSDGDVIDLAMVDAIMGGGDDAFTFIADAAFSGTAGELRFEQDGTNTMIYMDTDGDMVADYAIRLDGTINLAEADFVL